MKSVPALTIAAFAALCGGAFAQSDPSPKLELLARVPLPASGAKIWAHKNTVCIGSYTNAKLGVQIVDIADPAHPQLLGSLPRRLKNSAESAASARQRAGRSCRRQATGNDPL